MRFKLRPARLSLARMSPFLSLALGVSLGALALGAGAAQDDSAGEYIVVRHVLYEAADGTIAYEEASRERVSAQFVVNEHIWGVDKLPISVRYNVDGEPEGLDGEALIQQSINTWNAAGSNFAFRWDGLSIGFTGSCNTPGLQVDGMNTIKFTPMPPLLLGQTCTVYPPPKNSATKLVEFDMQLNTSANWSADSPTPGDKYDFPTTLLHELGHAAGIGHACGEDVDIECEGAHEPTVMYPTLKKGLQKRSLTPDDIDALGAAYGSIAAPTSTPTTAAPTASPTPTPIVTVPPLSPVLERARAPQLARD